MFKLIIFSSLIITGCATNNNAQLEQINKQLKQLDFKQDYFEYESTNRLCFLLKDICYLQATTTCQDNLCKQQQQKQCFKIHENCIVDNYRKWERIKSSKEK